MRTQNWNRSGYYSLTLTLIGLATTSAGATPVMESKLTSVADTHLMELTPRQNWTGERGKITATTSGTTTCRIQSHFEPRLEAMRSYLAAIPSTEYRAGRMAFAIDTKKGRWIIDCQNENESPLTATDIRHAIEGAFQVRLVSKLNLPEAEAKKSRFVLLPDYIVTQTGSYLGFVTLGVGWTVGRVFHFNIQGGWVPSFVNHGNHLWQLNLRTELHPFKPVRIRAPFTRDTRKTILWDPVYVGVSGIVGFDRNLFHKLPAKYPRGYYLPTAYRLAPVLGTGARYQNHEIFAEITALDVEIMNVIDDRSHVKASDVLNLGTWGAGYRYVFE